jgi:hypothetical protein
MSAPRPLPPRPSLEFARKEAKALLRQLRAGDPEARERARAQHAPVPAPQSAEFRLADAQLVLAREYGFASWPRLVRYFADADRQRHDVHRVMAHPRRMYESRTRSLLASHREARAWAARAVAAYVPRYYGSTLEEVFASTVTEDEARLVVARQVGYSSWEELVRSSEEEESIRERERAFQDPRRDAYDAIARADLDALQRLIASHPELLHPTEYERWTRGSLLGIALHHERVRGREAMVSIVEWLVAQGLGLRAELDRLLCAGPGGMKADDLRWLLERGASPHYVAPTGIPVLEYALLRYGDADAVDLLAAHTRPRRALWIAAGLGDVDGVRRSLDAQGRPRREATRLRPDFSAARPWVMPVAQLPDADDEDLLVEAFVVAMLNGRIAVLEHLIARGFPLNTLRLEEPLVNFAIQSASDAVVETLVRCGADLDARGTLSGQSAREVARTIFENRPENAKLRRIVELCGLDPVAILAERDARPVEPPRVHPGLEDAMALAGDDALRLGQSDVHPVNLFVGLLRTGIQLESFRDSFKNERTADLVRFRADMRERVRSPADRVGGEAPALRGDARAAWEAAIVLATERRSDIVTGFHLLFTLADDREVAELLARYGASAASVREHVGRAL